MGGKKSPTPSTSNHVSKPKQKSREGSVRSDSNQSEDSKQSGKSAKLNKNQDKKINSVEPPAAINSGVPNLHEAVIKLHNHTRSVREKLSNMWKPKIPPKVVSPSNAVRIVDTPPNTRSDGLLTETDILREIERLQELMKKIQMQKNAAAAAAVASTAATPEFKPNEICKSPEIDKGDPKPESEIKKRRRRSRKKKTNSESRMQEFYVRHLNEMVNKDTEVKDTKIPQFKLGDDLENFAMQCVEAGLGRIVEAELRVNAKNKHQSFITVEGGSDDAMLVSMATRRYAMDGDIVRAFVRNKHGDARESVGDLDESIPIFEDPNDTIDDPAEVLENDVEILKKSKDTALTLKHSAFVIRTVKESGNRRFVGSIAFQNQSKDDDMDYYKFKTRDSRAPIMCIPVESCTEFLKEYQSDDILGYLLVAEIVKIEESGRCLGKLIAPVGKCDDLVAENKAILMHNHLSDVQPFEQRFEDMWIDPVKIQKCDLDNREDLRDSCIFTIDPLTARDLDDAVSCKKLDNGRYEIGVHISDVAHFLEERTELDELVKLRATSIYLVNEVIHMLPKTLCMKCSLLPNEDKFTFSIFWVMDKDANVISTRFTRSIIRSCTQLAYEHAQMIIDNPNETFNDNDFPTICNGFNATDIVERVKILNSFAEIMRTRRFANGSLAIDKPQFYFNFDPKTGEPISYEIASRLTANFLIEEFMLLANQSVADLIYKTFPDIAFLRSHQPPKSSAMKSLKIKLNAAGIHLDMSTSKSIFDGLKKICSSSSSPEVVSVAMNYLLTKPMMRAKYFCSENVDEETGLRHYALAIPIYTHFTSPIRRYPDIIVHRLLSAAMKYTPAPNRTHEELHELARICNEQKFKAKNASEESSNLYFKRYIKEKKYLFVRAVVVDIYKHYLEVITLDTGHLIRVPFNLQKVIVNNSKAPAAIYISEQKSTKPPIELKMFSPVDIKLMVFEGSLTGFFESPDTPKSDQKPDADQSSSTPNKLNSKQRRNEKRNCARKAAKANANNTTIDEESK